MAIAIDFDPFEYVLRSDREQPAEKRTTFRLKPLDSCQRAQLEDMRYTMTGGTMQLQQRTGTLQRETLRAGLDGWDNLQDSSGEPVPFQRLGNKVAVLGLRMDPPSDVTLSRLHPDDAAELVEAINTANRLDDTDTGN